MPWPVIAIFALSVFLMLIAVFMAVRTWWKEEGMGGNEQVMNCEHAKQILEALAAWFAQAHTGPEATNTYLMGDKRTFHEHILAALMGEP